MKIYKSFKMCAELFQNRGVQECHLITYFIVIDLRPTVCVMVVSEFACVPKRNKHIVERLETDYKEIVLAF